MAVEVGEGDAAPMNVLCAAGVPVDANAHHDGGVLLDLPDFAERDVVAEAGHQARLQVERAQVSRVKRGIRKKITAPITSALTATSTEVMPERAIQLPRKRRARLERRRNRPGGAAANLQRDERGHRQDQK